MTMRDDARGSGARTILLLQCIAEGGADFTLKSIAEKLDLAPSTVHRLLQTLVAADIVEHAPSQSYRIGREFFRIASLVAAKYESGRVARRFLRELWNEWRETCAFAIYNRATETVTLAEVLNTPHPLKYIVEPMTELSLVWGSLGRAVMANLPHSEFEQAYTAAGAGPLSGRSMPPRGKLRADLQKIKERGFAVYEDRSYIDVAGVAAPVFNSAGDVMGSIGVLMPITRFDGYSLNKLGASVTEQAQRLSESLSHKNNSAD